MNKKVYHNIGRMSVTLNNAAYLGSE